MSKIQRPSNATLVITTLITGTIISTGIHQLLTSRETGDNVAVKSDLADSEKFTSPLRENVPEENQASKATPGVAPEGNDENGQSPEPQEDPEVVAYKQEVELLLARLNELKAERQAIRDRIQFNSPEI